jgi:hypothetical protein
MQYRVCHGIRKVLYEEGLTSAGDCTTGDPYTRCDHKSNLVLVPNGDAGSLDRRLA